MKKTIIIILVLVFIYFFIKVFTFNVFSVYNNYSQKDKAYLSLNKKNTITLKKKTCDDYLEVFDLKIRNDFKDYKLKKDKKNKIYQYILYDKDDKKKVNSSFVISKLDTFVNLFESNLEMDGIDNYWYKTVNRKKIIKDNKIENDLDLFEYVKKFRNKNNKITDRLSVMQENYATKFFVNTTVPLSSNMTVINGDFSGYIFNNKNYKMVNILYKKKRYVLTFYGEGITGDSYINDILDTLVIGE